MNRLRLWEPFGMIRDFSDAFENFGESLRIPRTERSLTPRTDISETDGEYEIVLEISGMDRKDLTLEVSGDVLTVSGEKRFEDKKEGKNYITVERNYGKFSRSFRLPENTDEKAIKADYKDGVLRLTVPKTEVKEEKPLKIEVK